MESTQIRFRHMTPDILCCIFNYNENAGALAWKARLENHFETVILDSGSNPKCPDALNLPNIYYSGLMNKAYELLLEKGCRWLMIVTSDIEISDVNAERLVENMKKISLSENVGLYQPSCRWSRRGRALPQSLCHFSGRIRKVNFQEGWFHMASREVLDVVLPVNTDINLLGWGIDLALCHAARVLHRLILVDDRVRVLHPRGTGYRKEEALQQMRAWHATIPGYVSPRHFRPLRENIRYRAES